jgi:hypothetical protein
MSSRVGAVHMMEPRIRDMSAFVKLKRTAASFVDAAIRVDRSVIESADSRHVRLRWLDSREIILPACATSSAQAIACNDDDQGYPSTVTAMNVPAGTYTIVVDSAGPDSGQFGLTVATQ